MRWQGHLGQDLWEREVDVAGARASVEEFWLALGGPIPESEVFRKDRKIVIDKATTNNNETTQVRATERFDL